MYYPKSTITENQFTAGGLLRDPSSGNTYKGYYHSTYDGKYFTGVSHSLDSRELTLLNTNDSNLLTDDVLIQPSYITNYNYGTITKNKMQFLFNVKVPVSYYPILTEKDYDNGQFNRYFMQNVGGNQSQSNITEISATGYQDVSSNVLYSSLTLVWKITGPYYDSGMTFGVYDTNYRTVQSKKLVMKGIDKYLINLTEFARIIS